MSLQRRLLLYLMLCAPLVWAVALVVSANRARYEVNELFDTEIIHLARQIQATLTRTSTTSALTPLPHPSKSEGEADLRNLGVAVWDAQGQLLMVDREGVQLPYGADYSGFSDALIADQPWRVYYLQSADAQWLVAAGQRVHERDEVVWNLIGSQLAPWLLVLPVLLMAMAWAVRQALAPVHALAGELQQRSADDLQPLPLEHAPRELQPLVQSMNGLFTRIETTLARERRFTADAAHELRTPLAVLRAQWDVLRGATEAQARQEAEARFNAGLNRMSGLVTQLLALSRLEATDRLAGSNTVNWPALVEQAINDVYALSERRNIEWVCEWPPQGAPVFPMRGDTDLLSVLLRNLFDNAARYAPAGSTVTLRFSAHALSVDNAGPALAPEVLAHLGERFHRPAGQVESGSGLGISIMQRIAALHGLSLRYHAHADGQGVIAELTSA